MRWRLLDAFRDGRGARPASQPIDDFNRGDNEGSVLFPGQPEARPALVGGARLPQAGAVAPEPEARDRRAASTGLVFDGGARSGVAVAAGRRERRARCARRSHPRGRRDRLAASAAAVGHRAGRAVARARHRRRARPAGRRRQSAGPSAAAPDLQGRPASRTLNTTYHSPLGRVGMALEYALLRRGPLTMAPSQLGVFTRSDPSRERANIQFHVQPLIARPLRRAAAPLPGLHRERLQSAADEPRRICGCAPPTRRRRRRSSRTIFRPTRTAGSPSIRSALVRRIAGAAGAGAVPPGEFRPGAAVGTTRPTLVKAAGDIGTTIFHPVGTAKMGRASDARAVVDATLRVHGLDRPARRSMPRSCRRSPRATPTRRR